MRTRGPALEPSRRTECCFVRGAAPTEPVWATGKPTGELLGVRDSPARAQPRRSPSRGSPRAHEAGASHPVAMRLAVVALPLVALAACGGGERGRPADGDPSDLVAAAARGKVA